jgi:hypothetical protein
MPNTATLQLISDLAALEREAIVAALRANDAEVELLASAANDYARRARDAALVANRAICEQRLPAALSALQQVGALAAQGDRRLTAAIERRHAALSIASAVMTATPIGRTQHAQRRVDRERARESS